jgi:hypothetical protein
MAANCNNDVAAMAAPSGNAVHAWGRAQVLPHLFLATPVVMS